MERMYAQNKKDKERCIINGDLYLSVIEKIVRLYEEKLLTDEEKDEYNLILKLYNSSPYIFYADDNYIKLFNFLLNSGIYQAIDYLVSMLNKDKNNIQFEKLEMGINTFCFKVDKYILKLGLSRYHYSLPSHYRLSPNCLLREQILDKKNKLIFFIEVQPLYKTNGFDRNDIDNLIYDLVKDGIEPTDPHIINRESSNFGLLNHYTDCRQVIPTGFGGITEGYKRYSLSPEFIKKPLIILDTDLLYYDKEKKKQYFYDLIDGLPFGIKKKLDKKKILKKL